MTVRESQTWCNTILTGLSLRGSLSVKSTEALTTQDLPAQRATQAGVVTFRATGTATRYTLVAYTVLQYVRIFRTKL
ncbi:hypothetical protein E2C01_089239 [Portunus trituberculatus]|uniref:Uncharacterized protein n=1 Tax=Portunus trituberculatus TaxID=210409 RepID=A0A5B7JLP7_PORTR|nr:hypothetical protein [Portunus trituberculatus]